MDDAMINEDLRARETQHQEQLRRRAVVREDGGMLDREDRARRTRVDPELAGPGTVVFVVGNLVMHDLLAELGILRACICASC